jgi:NhaP-type Na+/H+ or K+/H+ antiporter
MLLPIMRSSGYPIKLEHTFLLTWGALRGALGMFLSLILINNPKVDPIISLTILFHCSFIALLTLIVNGLTTKMVVAKLHLSKESSTSKKFMWMFIERISLHSQKKQNDFLIEHAEG